MDDLSSQLLDKRQDSWFEAVSKRRSRRRYGGVRAGEEVLAEMDTCCSGFRPYPDARVVLVPDPGVDVFKGAVGSYGKVTGAPHLLVFIAGPQPRAQLHIGYMGEACILEATRLGLNTCWVAGFFDRKRLARIVSLAEGERAVAVSPLGYAAASKSTSERAMAGMVGAHTRKPLSTVTRGDSNTWPEWARSAAECARLAPSAVNRQPWVFGFDGHAFVLENRQGPGLPGVTKQLDCGIAMLHAELGARAAGAVGKWSEVTQGAELARFEPTEGSAQ